MKNLFTNSMATLAIAAFMLSGCSDPSGGDQFKEVSTTENEQPDEHAHAHPSEGPHGGDLIELGNEEYHAELVHPHDHGDDAHDHHAEGEEGHKEEGEHKADHDSDHNGDHDHAGITIYILDGSAREMVAIEAVEITLNLSHEGKPEQFKLAAMPTESDPEGRSSRFASADKELMELFHESDHVEGTLVLSIDGKSYRGKLAHSHDDHHGHDHSGEEHGHKHDHAGDDALIWKGKPQEHDGLQILLGHHGEHLHAGEAVEPAVSIMRDGKPVSDARVYVSLRSADGRTELAKEVATVFEPTTESEPAHFAQGELTIPKDTNKFVISYRLEIPETEEVSFNVAVDAE